MDVMYNTLTKRAVSRAIRSDMSGEGKQLLPSEDAVVFVNNRRPMRDLTKAVKYGVGKGKSLQISHFSRRLDGRII